MSTAKILKVNSLLDKSAGIYHSSLIDMLYLTALHCKVRDSEKKSDQDVERMETDSDSDSDKDSEARQSLNNVKLTQLHNRMNNALNV